MTPTMAVVMIFAMLFCIIAMGVASHHALEKMRLNSGYYDEKPDGQSKSIDGNEIIHPADLYAIGGDFTITNGPEKRLCKHGLVLGKPTRDTLEVKWLMKEPEGK